MAARLLQMSVAELQAELAAAEAALGLDGDGGAAEGVDVVMTADVEEAVEAIRAELAPAARKLRDCGAAGCKKLAAAVGGGGGAAAKPAAKRPKRAA